MAAFARMVVCMWSFAHRWSCRNNVTALASWWWVVLAGWLFTGCVIVPIGQPGKQLHDQRKVVADELIRKHATRADVIQWLGPPSHQFEDLRVVAYLWRAHEWDVWWLLGSTAGTAGGTAEISRDHIFLLAFDQADQLVRWEIEHPYASGTIWQRARAWCLASGLPIPPLPARGAALPGASSDQSLLVVYWRRGGTFQFPPTDNQSYVTLTVDEQSANQLEKGCYTTLRLVPGVIGLSCPTSP